MALPTLSTSASAAFAATAAPTIAPGTVSVGDVVTVSICAQNNAAGSITSVTDSLGNTYVSVATSPVVGNRYASLYRSVITTGGTPTITVNLSASRTGRLGSQIWQNVDATPFSATTGTQQDGSAITSHVCSSVALNPEVDIAAICVVTCPNTGPVFTAGSGYTAAPTGGSGCFFQYDIASRLVNEQGAYSTNNAQQNVAVIAFLRGVRSSGVTQSELLGNEIGQSLILGI